MNDCLPEQSPVWQKVEQILRQVVASYGYSEVRMPIVEQTHLFKRAIGEVTDVVEKEMYTFEDRNGDSLSLRPEGTASCVRAGIEHGLLYNQERRMWYMGPMFRHERPQKGRYRQFHQFGVELFGINGPDIDAELIMLTYLRPPGKISLRKGTSCRLHLVDRPDKPARQHNCHSAREQQCHQQRNPQQSQTTPLRSLHVLQRLMEKHGPDDFAAVITDWCTGSDCGRSHQWRKILADTHAASQNLL